MDQKLSRISDLGRRFLNRHVLKRQAAAPARPNGAAPALPARAAAEAPAEVAPVAMQGLAEAAQAVAAPAGLAAPQYMTEAEMHALAAPPAPPGMSYVTEEQAAAYAAEGDDEDDSDSEDEDEPDYEEMYRAPVKHAQVNADAGSTGMKTKAAGAEYEGEYNKRGWRGNSGTKEKTDVVTRLYSEEEQKQNELVMKEDGSFRPSDEKLGYAMDGKGRMVAFKEADDLVATTHADGTVTKDDARFNGELQPGQRRENIHHSSVLGGDVVLGDDGKPVLDATGKPMMKGREAASAGFVTFDISGRITHISNCSGHYKPAVEYLVQAIEHLTAKGAFFKDEVTDAEGEPVDPDSKEGQLYEMTKRKLKAASSDGARIESLTAALQRAEEEGDEKAQATLAATIKEVGASLASLTKKLEDAQKILAKLGIGPSMRMRPATAEFVDAKDGMTGAAVRTSTTRGMSVVEFLRSGGGNNRQAGLKAGMLEDVVASGRLRRGDLTKLEELIAKPPPWTRAETAEVTRLKNAWDNALADLEAERRTEAAGPGQAPLPEAVDDALYELGKR